MGFSKRACVFGIAQDGVAHQSVSDLCYWVNCEHFELECLLFIPSNTACCTSVQSMWLQNWQFALVDLEIEKALIPEDVSGCWLCLPLFSRQRVDAFNHLDRTYRVGLESLHCVQLLIKTANAESQSLRMGAPRGPRKKLQKLKQLFKAKSNKTAACSDRAALHSKRYHPETLGRRIMIDRLLSTRRKIRGSRVWLDSRKTCCARSYW